MLPFMVMENFIQTKYFLDTFLKNNCQYVSMTSEQYLRKKILLYALNSHNNQ